MAFLVCERATTALMERYGSSAGEFRGLSGFSISRPHDLPVVSVA
jgi:hypothetical protein